MPAGTVLQWFLSMNSAFRLLPPVRKLRSIFRQLFCSTWNNFWVFVIVIHSVSSDRFPSEKSSHKARRWANKFGQIKEGNCRPSFKDTSLSWRKSGGGVCCLRWPTSLFQRWSTIQRKFSKSPLKFEVVFRRAFTTCACQAQRLIAQTFQGQLTLFFEWIAQFVKRVPTGVSVNSSRDFPSYFLKSERKDKPNTWASS